MQIWVRSRRGGDIGCPGERNVNEITMAKLRLCFFGGGNDMYIAVFTKVKRFESTYMRGQDIIALLFNYVY